MPMLLLGVVAWGPNDFVTIHVECVPGQGSFSTSMKLKRLTELYLQRGGAYLINELGTRAGVDMTVWTGNPDTVATLGEEDGISLRAAILMMNDGDPADMTPLVLELEHQNLGPHGFRHRDDSESEDGGEEAYENMKAALSRADNNFNHGTPRPPIGGNGGNGGNGGSAWGNGGGGHMYMYPHHPTMFMPHNPFQHPLNNQYPVMSSVLGGHGGYGDHSHSGAGGEDAKGRALPMGWGYANFPARKKKKKKKKENAGQMLSSEGEDEDNVSRRPPAARSVTYTFRERTAAGTKVTGGGLIITVRAAKHLTLRELYDAFVSEMKSISKRKAKSNRKYRLTLPSGAEINNGRQEMIVPKATNAGFYWQPIPRVERLVSPLQSDDDFVDTPPRAKKPRVQVEPEASEEEEAVPLPPNNPAPPNDSPPPQ